MRISIKENMVIVDDKPYHASEVFMNGLISGYLVITKSSSISGSLSIQGSKDIVLEPSNVLVIGGRGNPMVIRRLKIYEGARGVVAELPGKVFNKGEIIAELDNVESSIAISYRPLRVVLMSGVDEIDLFENPFSLRIKIRSPLEGFQARAKTEF